MFLIATAKQNPTSIFSLLLLIYIQSKQKNVFLKEHKQAEGLDQIWPCNSIQNHFELVMNHSHSPKATLLKKILQKYVSFWVPTNKENNSRILKWSSQTVLYWFWILLQTIANLGLQNFLQMILWAHELKG